MNNALNKQLHALLAQTDLMANKGLLVGSFTNGRSESSKDMNDYEAIGLITHLKGLKSKQDASLRKVEHDRANAMRKKIIALAHQMGWRKEIVNNKLLIINYKVDMKHINEWCVKYGYLHKGLNSYTVGELPKLVTQFDNLYKSFLKAI
jgi:hypothetical protein